MAPQEHSKPRNNARKAAARALQRQNPGMSYTQALHQVSKSTDDESTDNGGPANPLDLQALLNVTSADDIHARHDAQLLNTAVPVGISDSGNLVSLDLAHAHQQEAGIGPHGCVAGPGALNFVLAMATALRANNSVERVKVVYLGTERHARTAAHAVDVVVQARWHDWLTAQLIERGEIAQAAGAPNWSDLADDVASLVILLDVDHPLSIDDEIALERAARTGRSLGVHVIVIAPDIDCVLGLRPGIVGNLTFDVVLVEDGQRRIAEAKTLHDRDPDGPRDRAHLSFTPTRFSEGQLAWWINAARRPVP